MTTVIASLKGTGSKQGHTFQILGQKETAFRTAPPLPDIDKLSPNTLNTYNKICNISRQKGLEEPSLNRYQQDAKSIAMACALPRNGNGLISGRSALSQKVSQLISDKEAYHINRCAAHGQTCNDHSCSCNSHYCHYSHITNTATIKNMAHHGAHHNYTCTCTHTGSHTHNTLTAKPQIPDAAFLSCHEIITDVKLKPGNVEALPLPNSNNHLYHIMSATLHGVAAGITANELKRPKTRLIGNSKEHNTTSIYTATTTYEDGVLFMLQSTKDSSPLKGKLCIFDPASNNFTPGTPFLKLTSGTVTQPSTSA